MGNTAVSSFIDNLLHAEHILDTDFSFDLAEPSYQKCLKIVYEHPEIVPILEENIISMLEKGEISSEPIAYLMYCLRWPGLKAWLEQQLMDYNMSMTSSTLYNKILYSYDYDWGNKYFYKYLWASPPNRPKN